MQSVLSMADADSTDAMGGPTPRPGRRTDAVGAAVAVLRNHGLVAFPTETVWGLAARADSERAMRALIEWKGRQDGQPVSVLVSGVAALEPSGIALPEPGLRLAARFWPGALTLVVPCGRAFAAGVARADGAIGLRCSAHPVASALASAAEALGIGPLTATSFNRSGEPPVADSASALALCASAKGPRVFDGLAAQRGASAADARPAAPTSVLDLTTHPARLLREGGIVAAVLRDLGIDIETCASSTEAPIRSTPDPLGDSDE